MICMDGLTSKHRRGKSVCSPLLKLMVAMGALGNGRRGGRSPPLLIGALIACVLVLGFNYWVSSSRNLELQTKLYDMETTVRRAAAERSAVEQKKDDFEQELRRQSNQIDRMETVHKSQMETILANWKQEKANLLLNISHGAKTIQNMKAQFQSLFTSLGEIQKELQDCQTNQSKLNFDVAQCKAQMVALKKECDEREAAAKLEAERRDQLSLPLPVMLVLCASQRIADPAQGKDPVSGKGGVEKPGQDDTKKPSVPEPPNPAQPDARAAKPTVPETNEIPEVNPPAPAANDIPVSKLPAPGTNKMAAGKGGDAQSSLTGKDLTKPEEGVEPVAKVTQKNDSLKQIGGGTKQEEELLEVLDTHGEELQDKGKDQTNKGEEPGDDYNDEEPNAVQSEAGKQDQLDGNTGKEKDAGLGVQDLEEEIANYNGDDENEGEFEADKQAELAEN
ncbi:hypothetical protein AGOR_G00046580 [Albula goreensis]|uniref:Golgi membrane protein 1 n=1 Tax=Albula goreensis TaxID=1534307 RepID=A0A8T3DSK5_9TELE|nr:hypothetical protein AGOR_G00046580 [Albula goreensis]